MKPFEHSFADNSQLAEFGAQPQEAVDNIVEAVDNIVEAADSIVGVGYKPPAVEWTMDNVNRLVDANSKQELEASHTVHFALMIESSH